ncbi:transcriptional regulatory [Fusarium napiforme]|uniref:Transcriptional regulatory n=1 Tax=Fusarium napiforme TaxID=42672 RepID=A0A8H5JI35_9HYPO|nr:transcriptional regulatory [Fusarium napiforme]
MSPFPFPVPIRPCLNLRMRSVVCGASRKNPVNGMLKAVIVVERTHMRVEDLVQNPSSKERTPSTRPDIITADSRGDTSPRSSKSHSEEPQSSLVKDNSGHEHYIGPSGTLNFWNQLRNLVDSNNSPYPSPGREGVTKFTQDNTSRLLEADGQDEDDQPPHTTATPQDGPSPGAITSAIARDFTRLPTADMDEILGQFPSNQVLDLLIQSYFKNVHDDFPLFHRATFEEEYESFIVEARSTSRLPSRPLRLPDWGWIGCLHMIVVFGSIADRSIPNVDHSALRRRSIAVARGLLPQFISKCSLTNVRVLLLLSLFLHNNNERNAAWNIAGTATRISFALGLHRSDMSASFRPLEREVRKWVFCTLYSFEQFLASSLGRPSGLQELDVEVVPPREGFVEGGIGTDARLVSWSVKLQAILARTRLLHVDISQSSGPTLDEILTALNGWKRDIGKAPGLDVAWIKMEGPALESIDHEGAVDMEELKVSLAWKTRAQLRAVLLLHIHFHYIAIVATRPLLLRDVAAARKEDTPKTQVPTHAALCVKHACQLSYLMILLDHFDVINGLSGLDIFYAYCSAMILILRLLRLRPGEGAESIGPDEVMLQSKVRRLVATLRNVINHTDKCGSMKRLAQVVDTFSECANNPTDPPGTANLPPQGINMNNMPYPAAWSAEQVQGQGVALGSMEGLLDFLPFPGLGMAEGSLAQYVPGSEMEMTGWHDMEFLMEGYELVSGEHVELLMFGKVNSLQQPLKPTASRLQFESM